MMMRQECCEHTCDFFSYRMTHMCIVCTLLYIHTTQEFLVGFFSRVGSITSKKNPDRGCCGQGPAAGDFKSNYEGAPV